MGSCRSERIVLDGKLKLTRSYVDIPNDCHKEMGVSGRLEGNIDWHLIYLCLYECYQLQIQVPFIVCNRYGEECQ